MRNLFNVDLNCLVLLDKFLIWESELLKTFDAKIIDSFFICC